MGLLDDLLYNASPDNGPGLFGYLNNGKTAPAPNPDTKAATADELAIALGLNNIGTTQNATASAPSAPMAAPAGPAPQVPISTSNFTPPAAAAPAPMNSPVSAPQFGANPSPYLFPQSGTLFGANLPAPAAPPAVANANAAAPANASVDDDDDTPATPAQASPIAVGGYQMPRIGPAASFTPPAAATTSAPAPVAAAPVNPLAQAVQPARNFLDRTADALQSVSRGGSLTGAIRGQYDDAHSLQAASANLTAQALLKAGVAPDVVKAAIQPGNGELLKSLLPSLAPQMYTQETDKDGNVWNVNKQNGQKTIALQSKDDKFQNVEVKDANGNVIGMRPFNSKTADYGPIQTVPQGISGPPVPKVLGKGGELYHTLPDGSIVIDHKNQDAADATISDDTAKMMAQQYVSGDKTVLQNLGRGAQGSANLIKLRGAIKEEADKQGLDGNGIAQRMIDYVGDTARERTAATQEGRMAPAGIEAHGAIQLGRIASDAVPRGNWVPINKVIQAYEEDTSDPALRAFGSANTTIINTYARAINPNGVGTVADKEHARQMLSTADGPKAYNAVLDQLDKEIEMAHQSPSAARAGFKRERDDRLKGQTPEAPVTPAVPKLKVGQSFTHGDTTITKVAD